MGGGYTAISAPRQDRTRSINLRFLFLALVTFSVVAGVFLVESRRAESVARAHQGSESRVLDNRFGSEAERLESRLLELRTEAIRAIPFADRRRLPSGIVSASVWSKTSTGISRTLGFEASGVWEQALYRVLPATLAKLMASGKTRTILSLVGPEFTSDPSAETLRLGIFAEPDGVRTDVIAFRPATLFSGAPTRDGMKRYLIDENGLVLAHTNAAEVGERTSALADLYRKEESAADSPAMAHRLTSRSWEGFPTTIRFTRLPGWNAFFVMEKVHAPVRASTSPVLILIFISGSLLGILFLGLAVIRRKLPEAEVLAPIPVLVFPQTRPVVAAPAMAIPPPRQGLRELRRNPPPFIPRPSAISLGSPAPAPDLTSELGKFLNARQARSETHEQNRLRREKILLEEFETDARRARGQERLEEKLVESACGATKSPALFFRYDPVQGIARLSAEAGYPATQSIIDAGGMSFALDAGLVTDIHAEVARGRQKNLWEYAPLARIMLTRLGIANFEAWAMTEARKPSLGPSRLLGILVVAESGVDSVLHREFLGALLERASRHYARHNA
jgi:hypothetical protein